MLAYASFYTSQVEWSLSRRHSLVDLVTIWIVCTLTTSFIVSLLSFQGRHCVDRTGASSKTAFARESLHQSSGPDVVRDKICTFCRCMIHECIGSSAIATGDR